MTDSTPNPGPTEPASTVTTPKKNWTRFITPALALIAALVLGGVAGVLIGQNSGSRGGPNALGPGMVTDGNGGPQLSGGPANLTAGTIESIDGDTITVKLADGTTVEVTADADTDVTQTSEATVGDLAEGDEVTVTGEVDSDGNVEADSISEGGAFSFRGGPNGDGDSSSGK